MLNIVLPIPLPMCNQYIDAEYSTRTQSKTYLASHNNSSSQGKQPKFDTSVLHVANMAYSWQFLRPRHALCQKIIKLESKYTQCNYSQSRTLLDILTLSNKCYSVLLYVEVLVFMPTIVDAILVKVYSFYKASNQLNPLTNWTPELIKPFN